MRFSSRLIHWRDAQTASSSMAHASKAKIDQGSTAPKANGASNSTTQEEASSAVLVSLSGEPFATGAGSGWVAKTELTGCPWSHWNCPILRGDFREQVREQVRNRRAKACRELGIQPGSARSPAEAGWWSPGWSLWSGLPSRSRHP